MTAPADRGSRPMAERVTDPDVQRDADELEPQLSDQAEEKCRQILTRWSNNQRREAT